MSEPPPMGEDRFNWHDWGARLRLELGQFRGYMTAVLTSADEYLAELEDSQLDLKLETVVGERRLFNMINGPVLFNLTWHTGEISSLKGQQGQKGYDF